MKTTTKTSTIYVASDGTEFLTAQDCTNYEASHSVILRTLFEKLVVKRVNCYDVDPMMSDECDFIIVVANDFNEIMALNHFLQHEGNQAVLTTDLIGKRLLFFSDYEGICSYMSTVDSYIETIKNVLS